MNTSKKIVLHALPSSESVLDTRLGELGESNMREEFFLSHVKLATGKGEPCEVNLRFLSSKYDVKNSLSTSIGLGVKKTLLLLGKLFKGEQSLEPSLLKNEEIAVLVGYFFDTHDSIGLLDALNYRDQSLRMLQLLLDGVYDQMRVLPSYLNLPSYDGNFTFEKMVLFYNQLLVLIEKGDVEFIVFGASENLVGLGLFSSFENCVDCAKNQYTRYFVEPEVIVGNYAAENASRFQRNDDEYLSRVISGVYNAAHSGFSESRALESAKRVLNKKSN